jgi:dihydroorotate dehydrogenase (NAD+) catalytic subunit
MLGVKPRLAVNIGGVQLENPVLVASGTFGYGEEYSRFMDLNRLGGIVVKGLSLEPRRGNPPPRLVETPAGLLNAIGLENVGVTEFLNSKLPFLRNYQPAVIVNIFGRTVDEYVAVAEVLDGAGGIAALELNISCPNVKQGGLCFGNRPESTYEVVAAVRRASRLPLWVKLSPNATDIVSIAQSAADAGADALSLVNTFLGMAIDIHRRRPKLHNITGGLSGPAIKPLALRLVWEVARQIKLPVVGMGGILRAEDALEFIIAGAQAVAVGTANFVNPTAALDILAGIEEYLISEGIDDIGQLVGSLRLPAEEG